MEGDDSEFPPESSERSLSQRGSVASSVTRAQDVLVYLVTDSAVHLCVEGVGCVSVQEMGRSVREALNIPDMALDAFAFWLCSPLLELQLKPKHQPYKLCRQWQDLLYRFTDASEEDIAQDEPCLQYRRNVFYPKSKELQLKDEGVLRLLYDEARMNILEGRYPCDPEHWLTLGALTCAIELGLGLEDQKILAAIREKKLSSFLPGHLVMGAGGFLSTLRGKGGRHAELEQSLLREYRTLSQSLQPQESCHYLRQYLSTCHLLPYYGCAFFSAEIDKPAQGLLHRGGRKAVTVGISLEGVYVMDFKEKHVLLGLRFNELSWDHSYPEGEGDSHILWLEFDGEEEGTAVNKLLKIYSKQAELMSGLIEFCVELRSVGEAAATSLDCEVGQGTAPGSGPSEVPAGQVGTTEPRDPQQQQEQRGQRRSKLRRQSSVVCSRVHSLNTISYVDDGKRKNYGVHINVVQKERHCFSCARIALMLIHKLMCCSIWVEVTVVITYGDTWFVTEFGKEIKRLKPKRAASFFTRQAPPQDYTAVQVAESLEQG